VYAATSYCFDLSVFELFYPLSVGRKIRILNSSLDIGMALAQETAQVLINTVPSAMRHLLDGGYDLERVRVINLAGEPFPVDIAERLLQEKDVEVRNLYGPSEDTTYSTIYQLERNKRYTGIPIGKPISNTRAYILDEGLQLLPPGVIGKLYLSGDGLASGYLNREELTREKFIDNPYEAGSRMYDTGDLARWLPDGNIEYLGRKDQQVKIRGYRIELGEIEHALLQYPGGIKQAVVDAKELKGEKVMVAYYVAEGEIDKETLRAYLQEQLPAYMVPGYYVALAALPLSPNGKTDRKQLPGISGEEVVRREYVAPVSETEIQLVAIWQEVLGVEKVGITDDFFELGGHSLLLTKLSGAYQQTFKVTLNMQLLFTSTCIKEHAQHLAASTQKVYDIEPLPAQEYYDLSPSQNRYWLIYKIHGKSKEFNIYSTFPLPDELNLDVFQQAFGQLVRRHEALRSQFLEEAGMPKLQVLPHQAMPVPVYGSAEKAKQEVFNHEFELETAPLFKVGIVQEGTRFTLFFNMHHIISDGWSLNVITRDLLEYYFA
ncbi:MAG: AMP-binding protein, partial [Dinghuibacter sp.]|nr:AMP-binding protein [Dinghuibacter sp.]